MSRRPVIVADAMRSPLASVDEVATPRRILAALRRADVAELPIVGSDGAFRGMVEEHAVERHLYDRGEEDATAAAMAEEPVARASSAQSIEGAVDKMLASGLEVLPIVSADGRLEGTLVLEDLRQVPGLVEGVGESRRRRAVVAGEGYRKVLTACGLASAGLGLLLFSLWIEGPVYGLPRWVAWADGLAALLAFIGAATVFSPDLFSVPVWAVSGIGLLFTVSLAHAWHDGPWSTWLQLAFAVTFLLLVAVLGMALPRRRHAGYSRRLATT